MVVPSVSLTTSIQLLKGMVTYIPEGRKVEFSDKIALIENAITELQTKVQMKNIEQDNEIKELQQENKVLKRTIYDQNVNIQTLTRTIQTLMNQMNQLNERIDTLTSRKWWKCNFSSKLFNHYFSNQDDIIMLSNIQHQTSSVQSPVVSPFMQILF